jgi:hypothetical protein
MVVPIRVSLYGDLVEKILPVGLAVGGFHFSGSGP